MSSAVVETHFPDLKLKNRGKVRDIYDLDNQLLIVTTDRISAFDVIMNDPIPDKGKVLTQISLFWFDVLKEMTPNHLITASVADYPKACMPYADMLRGRSMLVKKASPLPIECVVRGYLSGSGWKSYQTTGTVCGIPLPPGLVESDRLPRPIFTPSTKEETGHDINIEFEEACQRIGGPLAERIRELSIGIYEKGVEIAAQKGIIIADTKFEFGLIGDDIILIDEVMTPDSSRFWPGESYRPGGGQKSFDKQYLRDYLLSIGWNQQPPPPPLPAHVIENTRNKYLDALRLLAGPKYAID
ncbi:MAG TPA: phosphoribosylaminoimidazolesuccinocarboxamide synthase [Desulfatirhabdiaceae bacterium]|nr:phosphoribosylaminoimidazolesuccinocarboxamide synthase [Desulfatirhabdiaceae bacterium]